MRNLLCSGLENHGNTTDGDESTLAMISGSGHLRAASMILTWLLSWQQTGVALQPLPLTPTTVIGLQVRPTRAVTSLTTMPSSPRRVLAAGDDA
jgi:hypothetical protein